MAPRTSRLHYLLVATLATGWLWAMPASAQSFLDKLIGSTSSTKPTDKHAGHKSKSKPKPTPTARTSTSAHEITSATTAPQNKVDESAVMILAPGRLTGFMQTAEDIMNVLEGIPNNDLRVMPALGKSSEQNIRDMLVLRSADMAVVDQDTLEYLKKKDKNIYAGAAKHINYIAKLFSTEVHVYSRAEIKTLADLKNKKVICHSSATTLCERLFQTLKINAQLVYDADADAREKVLKGEAAAVVLVANPPFSGLETTKPEDNLHFLPITAESFPAGVFDALKGRYQPAWLMHTDYPTMISNGEDVPTIATSSVLVVYAWPTNNPRYSLTKKFVELFFDNLATLRKAPRHPKWREVNLAAELPGWTRFPPAEQWLKNSRGGMLATVLIDEDDVKMNAAFQKFVADYAKVTGKSVDGHQKELLYPQFIAWWSKQNK
jgi:uncharacterized protein